MIIYTGTYISVVFFMMKKRVLLFLSTWRLFFCLINIFGMSLQSGDVQLTPQERLEKVWNALEMPDNLKLDMAIKYSTNEYYVKLFEVSHYCNINSMSSFCMFKWCTVYYFLKAKILFATCMPSILKILVLLNFLM